MDDLERLRIVCNAVEDDPERHERISELLAYVADADPKERESERFHKRIWGDTISGVGSGNVNVDPAISDMEFRQWLADVSFRSLPANRHCALKKIRKIWLIGLGN